MDASYILNHLGEENKQYGAMVPPIVQTSNFAFNTVADFRNALKEEQQHYIYTRGNNPTIEILRKKIAALEKTDDALITASGSAAIATAVMAFVQKGDHIICVQKPYSWTKNLMEYFMPRFGVEVTFIDGTVNENFDKAIRPNTKLIYLESPNSITLELQDLAYVAALAKSKNITTIIDNTYCSPLYQNPFELGIDIIIHSASKYFGGHSDIVAGAICGSHLNISKIFRTTFMTFGGIVSPNDAWLMIRSMRTLELRVKKSNESAAKVANYLSTHAKVEKLIFPFHPSFSQYNLAKQQMRGTGGILSFLLKAESVAKIEKFADSLKHFLLAVSWGGHESLVLPVAGLTNDLSTLHPTMPWNLVRLYVGLDDVEVLIGDLQQAFEVYDK
jgi:cystathionine beta-lyase